MNKLFIKILGSGASIGCPVPGCDCSVCTSNYEKNNRTRTSLFVKIENSKDFQDDNIFNKNYINILFDCGPDVRYHMLKHKVPYYDYLFLTHKHADHTAGMDDVRISYFNRDEIRIPCYANQNTFEYLMGSFNYMFYDIKYHNSNKYFFEHDHVSTAKHPNRKTPLLGRLINNDDDFDLPNGSQIKTFEMNHGGIKNVGYIIDSKFAYSTDMKSISQENLDMLRNLKLKLWILPFTYFEGNNVHASFDELKEILNYVKPERALFTHMSHQIDFRDKSALWDGVEFGYDGMEFEM